jgi:hypothetical protein
MSVIEEHEDCRKKDSTPAGIGHLKEEEEKRFTMKRLARFVAAFFFVFEN